MRLILCALLLAAPWARAANETTDRAGVDKVFFALKDALGHRDAKAVDKLLAAGSNRAELAQSLLNLSPGSPDSSKPNSSKEVWSEQSRPVLIIDSVRFPESNLAEVATLAWQFGSVSTHKAPVILLLKRERSGWKIASLRVGPPSQ